MSVAASIAIGTVYGMFVFGSLGSPRMKYCLANQVDFAPQPYENQQAMVDFL